MASVDWQKATTQKAGAMKKHNGKDERVNGNHSNNDIDKSKSHLNVYIGADDYAPMLDKVKARIKEVDEKYPPKRNMGDKRITCIMLETPVPQEITEQGKAEDFLRNAHKVIEDFFGAENVGGTCGHFDEQHWYTDKDGKERMSLVHGHTLVAAYAEWQDKKTGELRRGINGKNCETKTRLRALNKAMDDMCLREYGISYNTAETPEHKSVERLKEETELRREADMQRKEIAELSSRVGELERAVDRAWNDFVENDAKAKEAEVRQSDAEERTSGAEKRLTVAEQKLKEVNGQYEEATKGLKDVLDKKARASEIRRSIFDREVQSYHVNMLESTRAIGSEAYDRLMKANKLRQEAVEIQLRAERKEQAIEPLYQQAQAAKDRADREERRAKQLRKNIEQEIELRADELSDRKIQEMFGGAATKRERRLEDFCDEVKFSDGTSVLDAFLEHEKQLKKGKFKGR